MSHQQAVTVYGSSSAVIDDIYKTDARELGRLIALSGRTLVSGGGREGLMGAAIEGAADAGGATVGVLPQFMIERGWNHPKLDRTVATPDMHTRKAEMARLATAAAVAMPGGVGTFDELFEIMTWRQLGLFSGSLVILNTAGYYDPLLAFLDRAASLGFMRPASHSLYAVASTPAEAVAIIDTNAPAL